MTPKGARLVEAPFPISLCLSGGPGPSPDLWEKKMPRRRKRCGLWPVALSTRFISSLSILLLPKRTGRPCREKGCQEAVRGRAQPQETQVTEGESS